MTRLYRATWVDPDWSRRTSRDPGHPLHVAVARQGGGRFDNPSEYVALYLADAPEAAVGEALGSFARWIPDVLTHANGVWQRALVTVEVEETAKLIDLDDAALLVELGVRPSDVVRRDRTNTQHLALDLHRSRRRDAAGIRWWSYYQPDWRPTMLWSTDTGAHPVDVVSVDVLSLDHPAVVDAASQLPRVLG